MFAEVRETNPLDSLNVLRQHNESDSALSRVVELFFNTVYLFPNRVNLIIVHYSKQE